MKNNKSKRSISRRKFLKDVGAGVVGGTLITKGIKAKPVEKDQQEDFKASVRKVPLSLKVNGKQVYIHIEPNTTLLEVIRDQLHLTGTKLVCNQGECGACTVLLDGEAIYSCHFLAMDAANKEVTTIEGLLTGEELHPLQEAFIEHDGMQCGFCTPGQVLSAQALLLKNPNPNREEVTEAMSGNLCRCAAYPKIIDSVIGGSKIK
jgi:xanthine dehydrogenase YagT iron-sulfur-binding subunit